MSLSSTQRRVRFGMAGGVVLSIALLVTGVSFDVFRLPQDATISQRLSFAAPSLALFAWCLTFAIGRLARHRFFSPEDIHGAALRQNSERAALLQTLLQNTLEQSLLAAIVHLCWAITMPPAWLTVILFAAVAFVVGRVLFFVGYSKGAAARALGFALTFYPSVIMLICNCLYLVWLGTN